MRHLHKLRNTATTAAVHRFPLYLNNSDNGNGDDDDNDEPELSLRITGAL